MKGLDLQVEPLERELLAAYAFLEDIIPGSDVGLY
jgi:hypothetical protein